MHRTTHFLQKISLLLMVLTIISSCSSSTLSVRSSYFSKSDLASVKVDTPDPLKDQPYFGQLISIHWHIPQAILRKGSCTLHISYRLHNGEEKHENIEIDTPLGSHIFYIQDKDFTEKGGLLSYLVILSQDSTELAKEQHKFWVNTLTIQTS